MNDNIDGIEISPLPWARFALMVLISVAGAWLACHLTGYVWWFPVGMAAYTATSILCFAILGLDKE